MTDEQLQKANLLVKIIKEMGQFVTCEEWSGDEIIATYHELDRIMDAWEERNNMPEGRSYFFYLNDNFKHSYELRFVNDEIAESIMNHIVWLRKQFSEL